MKKPRPQLENIEARTNRLTTNAPARKQKKLPLRHQGSVVKAIPAEFLTAAIAERLIFAFHIEMTTRANRKSEIGTIAKKMFSVVDDLQGKAIREFFVCGGEPQQLIRRLIQSDTELFQCIDCRGGFSARDGTEMTGAETAELGSGFVGKIVTITDTHNRGGKFL